MSDEPETDEPEREPETDEPEPDQPETEEPDAGWQPPTRQQWEQLRNAVKATRRERKEAQEKLRELQNGATPEEPDPVQVANARLVKAEARTQLAAAGITERADVRAVLDILSLDGVDVDGAGEVDEDEVAERIATLRRVFGGNGRPAARPRVETRDRGSAGGKSDPDSERYARIIGRR